MSDSASCSHSDSAHILAQVSSPEFDSTASMKHSVLGRECLAMQQLLLLQQQQQHALLVQQQRADAKLSDGGVDVTDAFFQMELSA